MSVIIIVVVVIVVIIIIIEVERQIVAKGRCLSIFSSDHESGGAFGEGGDEGGGREWIMETRRHETNNFLFESPMIWDRCERFSGDDDDNDDDDDDEEEKQTRRKSTRGTENGRWVKFSRGR